MEEDFKEISPTVPSFEESVVEFATAIGPPKWNNEKFVLSPCTLKEIPVWSSDVAGRAVSLLRTGLSAGRSLDNASMGFCTPGRSEFLVCSFEITKDDLSTG